MPAAARAVRVGDRDVVRHATRQTTGVVNAEELIGLDCDPLEFGG